MRYQGGKFGNDIELQETTLPESEFFWCVCSSLRIKIFEHLYVLYVF